MALQGTDLLVVQSQDDKELYKLRVDALGGFLEGGSGIQFRGSADLRAAPEAQSPNPVDLTSVVNGDLYIVEEDAPTINAGWVMEGGAGAGTASKNDRIIWDGTSNFWLLVEGGSSTGGLIETITVTTPLQSDNDPTNPAITIDEATTTAPGVAKRLATEDDVKHTDGTGGDAVVTADLLKATNDNIKTLEGSISVSGIQSIAEDSSPDVVAGALKITSETAAKIGVNSGTFVPFNFSTLPDINT